jgi:tRNA (guanine10-N2)-dimethyltransferase
VLIAGDGRTIIARTTGVQDITSYTRRDRGRPKRDARVGMLPPKLAQIIINLAAASTAPGDKTVLDPFCGTGVVLQEAMLMGFNVYGTDLEKRMIDYSYANLEWLRDTLHVSQPTALLKPGDATSHTWGERVDFVASETYLGRPFTSAPNPEVLAKTISECNAILKKFLQNMHGQLQPGARLCLAIPAWQVSPGKFKHLPLIDQIEDLGYNRLSFEHTRSEDLLYYRADQIVARQLLVLQVK